jgi:hypothetical protein
MEARETMIGFGEGGSYVTNGENMLDDGFVRFGELGYHV